MEVRDVDVFTKKWFLGEFDSNGEGFDMEQAKKEIADYRIAKAVLGASPAANDEKNDEQGEAA